MNDSVFLQHHVCPISGEQNQSTLTFNFVFVNYTGNSETSSAERNWPDDREQDGSTADQVHEEEDLLPQVVFTGAFLRGLDDDVGYISKNLQATGDRYMSADCSKPHITDLSHAHTHTHTDLQGDDDHEDLLLFVRQDVFDKSPAGADECQGDEEQSSLQPGGHNHTHIDLFKKKR